MKGQAGPAVEALALQSKLQSVTRASRASIGF